MNQLGVQRDESHPCCRAHIWWGSDEAHKTQNQDF